MPRNKIVNYGPIVVLLIASVNQPWLSRECANRFAVNARKCKEEGFTKGRRETCSKELYFHRVLGCYHRREEDEYSLQLFSRGKIDRHFYELSESASGNSVVERKLHH